MEKKLSLVLLFLMWLNPLCSKADMVVMPAVYTDIENKYYKLIIFNEDNGAIYEHDTSRSYYSYVNGFDGLIADITDSEIIIGNIINDSETIFPLSFYQIDYDDLMQKYPILFKYNGEFYLGGYASGGGNWYYELVNLQAVKHHRLLNIAESGDDGFVLGYLDDNGYFYYLQLSTINDGKVLILSNAGGGAVLSEFSFDTFQEIDLMSSISPSFNYYMGGYGKNDIILIWKIDDSMLPRYDIIRGKAFNGWHMEMILSYADTDRNVIEEYRVGDRNIVLCNVEPLSPITISRNGRFGYFVARETSTFFDDGIYITPNQYLLRIDLDTGCVEKLLSLGLVSANLTNITSILPFDIDDPMSPWNEYNEYYYPVTPELFDLYRSDLYLMNGDKITDDTLPRQGYSYRVNSFISVITSEEYNSIFNGEIE